MQGISLSLSFNTYQDVKRNLSIWTFFLLVVFLLVSFSNFLTPPQQKDIIAILSSGISPLLGNLISFVAILLLYFGLGIVLIYGFQVHDVIYDRFIIRWREQYDLDVILPSLTEPIRQYLPKNFIELAKRSRYKFMKPFYYFVGDGKAGIEQNTRVRFYERVTLYWATQINELFLLAFLVGFPMFVLTNPATPLSLDRFAWLVFVAIILVLVNRMLIRIACLSTKQATLDEIEEIQSKLENVTYLKDSYIELCKSYTT